MAVLRFEEMTKLGVHEEPAQSGAVHLLTMIDSEQYCLRRLDLETEGCSLLRMALLCFSPSLQLPYVEILCWSSIEPRDILGVIETQRAATWADMTSERIHHILLARSTLNLALIENSLTTVVMVVISGTIDSAAGAHLHLLTNVVLTCQFASSHTHKYCQQENARYLTERSRHDFEKTRYTTLLSQKKVVGVMVDGLFCEDCRPMSASPRISTQLRATTSRSIMKVHGGMFQWIC